MYRLLYHDLVAWKDTPARKPLMLEGARQVGKTYLLKRLGECEYENFYYLNFDEEPGAISLFEGSISAETILKKLSMYFQKTIQPENSLICFDEIQECSGALASLKYFCEDAPEYHVAAAGSLLGVKLKGNKGFPVGKVTFRQLYPLSFIEYLLALGKKGWVDLLTNLNINEPVPELFHDELIDALKTYLFVGGMPEAVTKYVESDSFEEVSQVHRDILRAYEIDFAKHATPHDAAKISLIWGSIPSQLAKENKKFIYSVIRPSARAREYKSAIQWLVDANLILKCYNISKPGIPLKSYADHEVFKTYLLDVGLLSAMSGLQPKTLVEDNILFSQYKGALTENYIAQVFNTLLGHPLFYWSSEGRAEVDFIIEDTDHPIPVEVKAGRSKHKKSLYVYQGKYKPPLSICTSPLNVRYKNGLLDVPLYLINQLKRLVQQAQNHS